MPYLYGKTFLNSISYNSSADAFCSPKKSDQSNSFYAKHVSRYTYISKMVKEETKQPHNFKVAFETNIRA